MSGGGKGGEGDSLCHQFSHINSNLWHQFSHSCDFAGSNSTKSIPSPPPGDARLNQCLPQLVLGPGKEEGGTGGYWHCQPLNNNNSSFVPSCDSLSPPPGFIQGFIHGGLQNTITSKEAISACTMEAGQLAPPDGPLGLNIFCIIKEKFISFYIHNFRVNFCPCSLRKNPP